jgi:hypothetical protein
VSSAVPADPSRAAPRGPDRADGDIRFHLLPDFVRGHTACHGGSRKRPQDVGSVWRQIVGNGVPVRDQEVAEGARDVVRAIALVSGEVEPFELSRKLFRDSHPHRLNPSGPRGPGVEN